MLRIATLIAVLTLGVSSASAHGMPSHYPLKPHHHCVAGYVKKVERVKGLTEAL
jgi:hypothetical protein